MNRDVQKAIVIRDALFSRVDEIDDGLLTAFMHYIRDIEFSVLMEFCDGKRVLYIHRPPKKAGAYFSLPPPGVSLGEVLRSEQPP